MSNKPNVKKTMVSISAGGRRCTYFLDLEYNEKGQAVLPLGTLNNLPIMRGLQRGATYSIG